MKKPPHHSAHRSPLLALYPLCCALFFTSCASPEFSASWRAAKRAAVSETGVEGAWSGTWKSEATGHTGALRCVVSPIPESVNTYDFHYWASWKRILAGDYHVTYAVGKRGEKYIVTGEKDLGSFLGGVYTHQGVATPAQFDATYRSDKDHGSFTMTRP